MGRGQRSAQDLVTGIDRELLTKGISKDVITSLPWGPEPRSPSSQKTVITRQSKRGQPGTHPPPPPGRDGGLQDVESCGLGSRRGSPPPAGRPWASYEVSGTLSYFIWKVQNPAPPPQLSAHRKPFVKHHPARVTAPLDSSPGSMG